MKQAEINRVVFDALVARKSIYIEGFGVVYTSLVSGNKSAPKFKSDFIRYEILFSVDKIADIDLKSEVGEEEFINWQTVTIKSSFSSKSLNIEGVIKIKVCDDKIKSYSFSPEVDLQLNPLGFDKKDKRDSLLKYTTVFLIIFLAVGIYFFTQSERFELWESSISYNSSNSISNSSSEEVIGKKDSSYSSKEEIIIDVDTSSNEQKFTIPHDTIVAPDVMEVINEENESSSKFSNARPQLKLPKGVVEPEVGRHYLVAGSFKTADEASMDAIRLKKLSVTGTVIMTTTKPNSGFINFLAIYNTYDEAYAQIAPLSKKHPKIKGIWVYTMPSN